MEAFFLIHFKMQLSYFLYPQHSQTSTFFLNTVAPAVEALARSFVFFSKTTDFLNVNYSQHIRYNLEGFSEKTKRGLQADDAVP